MTLPRSRPAWWIRVLKLGIAMGLIAWLLNAGRMDLGVLRHLGWGPCLWAALGALCLALALQALRWWVLLRMQDIPMSLWAAIRISWIAQFFTVFLPGAAGGDVYRIVATVRAVNTRRVAASLSVVVDRVIGLYAVICMSFLVMLAIDLGVWPDASGLHQMSTVVYVLMGVSTCGVVAMLTPAVSRSVGALVPARFQSQWEVVAQAYTTFGRGLVATFALSVLAGLFMVLGFYAAAYLLNDPAGLGHMLVIVPLITLANSIPLSPGGIGVAEVSASMMFACVGVSEGAMIALLVRALLLLIRLGGGLMYVLGDRRSLTAEAPTEPESI